MEMEKQMFGKQMFAGPCKDNGSTVDSASLGLAKSPPPHQLIFFADNSGYNSILFYRLLAKFFNYLRGSKKKDFPSLRFLKIISLC